MTRCIGCKACMTSCKAENNVPLGVFRNHVRELEKGRYPTVKRILFPVLCNHCDTPACKGSLPKKIKNYISKRDDGIVVWDERLKGAAAKEAVEACPYSNPYIDPQTKSFGKCDYCAHRVDAGSQPACVATCIGGARVFGDMNDSKSEIFKYMSTHATQILKPEEGTEPNTFYVGLDRHASSGLEGSKQLSTEDIVNIPVANFRK